MQSYKSTLNGLWKGLCVFLTFGILLGLGTSFLKIYEDSTRSKERSRLVVSIVDEQLDDLFNVTHAWESAQNPEGSRRARSMGANNLKLTPGHSNDELVELRQSIRYRIGSDRLIASSTWKPALSRWYRTLSRWAHQPSGTEQGLDHLSSDQLLSEGRKHYFEAVGLRKIGKPYDATVLNLWSIVLLTKFIEKNALSPAMPEVLFMVGDAYIGLDSALPFKIKRDRILNLCSELYPDSVWANRANSIWKEEFGNAI
jgi:hypothetical protein